MKEITVKKEYETPVISLIPLHHAPREIIARGRYGFLGLCIGFCGASAYFMWALGVI